MIDRIRKNSSNHLVNYDQHPLDDIWFDIYFLYSDPDLNWMHVKSVLFTVLP